MRTNEERVKELHRRMMHRKKEKNIRKYALQCAAACAVCLVITVVIAFVIAHAPVPAPSVGADGVSASMFAGHALLGYVVVALLAFCLGAVVTVFCFRLRKHMEEKDDDRYDR